MLRFVLWLLFWGLVWTVIIGVFLIGLLAYLGFALTVWAVRALARRGS